MKNYFLTVELVVDHDVQVVLLVFDVDGHIDTVTSDVQWNGLCVVLVIEEEGQLLTNGRQFSRDKSKLNFSVAVALNLSDSLEAHCRNELIENDLFIALDLIVVLGQLVWTNKGNGAALGRLNVNLGREGSLIVNVHILSRRFAKDNVSEFNIGVLYLDECLLAGANERNLNEAGLSQDREETVDIFVELRRECDRNRGAQTCAHAAGWRVNNIEKVFNFVFQRHQLE